ncbi:MAG: DinB family protein [Vicingaceae bacterium]
MEKFFKDIFEYHHQTNQRLIQLLLNNEAQLTERIIYLISHSLNAHQIWNARITDSKTVGVHDLHELKICAQMDDENFRETLSILNNHELSQKVSYQNSKGDIFQNSVQEVLFHISNHFSHHRGQIATFLRQQNIQPPATDYIFYKR